MRQLHLSALCLMLATASFAQPDSVWTLRFAMEGYDIQNHHTLTKDHRTGNLVFVRALPGRNATCTNYLTSVSPDGEIVSNIIVPGDQRIYDVQALIQTRDDNFAMVGGSPQGESIMCEVLLLRMDLDGNLKSMCLYENPNSDHGYGLIQMADGGFGLGGFFGVVEDGGFEADFWLIRTDVEGSPIFSETFGERDTYEQCRSVCETDDGGLLGVGNDGARAYVVRTDSEGRHVWSRQIGKNYMRDVWDVKKTGEDNYTIVGSIESNQVAADTLVRNDFDGWVVNLDDNGEQNWEFTTGGDYDDAFKSVIISRDGNLVLAGYSCSDSGRVSSYWLCKITTDGEPIWEKTFFEEGQKSANAVVQMDNGGYALIGTTEFSHDDPSSVLLLATEPDDEEDQAVEPDFRTTAPNHILLHELYPNPVNSTTSIGYYLSEPAEIEIAVFNPSGRRVGTVHQGKKTSGEHKVQWKPENIQSGIYFVRLNAGGESAIRKVLIVK